MRLLLFLDTDHLSGPARLARDFAVRAIGLGHEVLVLGLVRGPRPAPTLFVHALEQAGVPAALLHERHRFDPAIFTQFDAHVRRFGPDVYQSHGYKGSLLGLRAQRMGLPWQAVFHGFTRENWLVRWYHALDARWLRRADEVLVVARSFAPLLARRGVALDRMRWVPNAIDPDWMDGMDTMDRADRSPGAVTAGFVGRLSPEKGPDVFLRAVARAAARVPALRGLVAGDGPMRRRCERLAGRLGIADRVRFVGFCERPAAIYRTLDLLVVASRSEGLPMALLEAMAAGVPVAAMRVGGIPDAIEDGRTGLLAPAGDASALGDAVARLAEDATLRARLAEAARRLGRERFDPDRRAQTLLEHLRALAERLPLPGEPPAGAPS